MVWQFEHKPAAVYWAQNKGLAEQSACRTLSPDRYTQLNSDVFIGTVTVDWQQMRDEYEHSKKVTGNKEVSIYETALTLGHFERLVGRCNSRQITQNAIDQFILQRGQEVKRLTLNKDIRNLKNLYPLVQGKPVCQWRNRAQVIKGR